MSGTGVNLNRRASSPASDGRRGWPQGCGRRAFTLIEIVLAISLFLILTAVAALTFGGWRQGQNLAEGSQTMVTTLRMARADAANHGKRLQLVFDQATGQATLYWEPEPLTKPGQFAEYTGCTWKSFLANPDVLVRRCNFTGSSTYRTIAADTGTGGGSAEAPTLAAITFEPDGSSDSVVIEMVPAGGAGTQHAIIELEGLTGRVSSRIEMMADTGTAASP